ncbi:PA3496 family putative envelope integrity protein [Pseudomonas sp. NPDC096917]|uniref:PA3496 family putative envelope integrity protein n=1 Tax=Pseudomonas sp. NPDC096917 TaxID=3364483 RepID=UPI00383B8F94
MSTGKEQLVVDTDDEEGVQVTEQEDTKIEVAKTNLAKRRDVDDYLEKRRLQRELEGGLKDYKI